MPLSPVFRFAPTPNGRLHAGHAYSALLNDRRAQEAGGRLLLRLEDTDPTRCRPEFEAGILEDLDWLGVVFETPPRRQSDHWPDYDAALGRLQSLGLLFPCLCTRGDIAARAGGARDPDGSPLHRGLCCDPADPVVAKRLAQNVPHALRLDVAAACARAGAISFAEFGEGEVPAAVAASPLDWGDVVLRGKERPATYHLAVVVDDALQGVTDVVRGRDLLPSTSIHRLLQALLDLPTPRYRHHRLVLDSEGVKLSKSAASTPLADLRKAGLPISRLRAELGLAAADSSLFRYRLS